jgi:hypothetical protein
MKIQTAQQHSQINLAVASLLGYRKTAVFNNSWCARIGQLARNFVQLDSLLYALTQIK